jgi:hypothetical protein
VPVPADLTFLTDSHADGLRGSRYLDHELIVIAERYSKSGMVTEVDDLFDLGVKDLLARAIRRIDTN